MTSPSENLNLAIIPYEYQESPFILPDVMLIDFFGITHLVYPLMEGASILGVDENQSLVHTTSSDEDNTPLAKMIPKKLRSQLRRVSSNPTTASIKWSHCNVICAAVITRSTKKIHGNKSKFVPPENPIDVADDISITKKNGKRKKTAFGGHCKEQDTLTKSVKKSKYTDDSDGDMVVVSETRKVRILEFKRRKMIRDSVVTAIGGQEMGELLGNRWRKMGRKETREFYINVTGLLLLFITKYLKAFLTMKNEEIVALRVAHSADMDQLHISYGLEHAGLVEENSQLKDELAKTQAARETKRSSNSTYLKNLVDLFAKGSPSSSSCVPPFV
ncbi:hypothetical protein R3W88_003170 [Solanum pinnatisectum]|uniref:Uncharacterized protein n=1 Tax=Solanum pinnatisectum TaxID=50273 RepID=A0AAV9MNU5_9SOLN|nr:hypothetical protein R3W88_003170 [Solanum pinnatisectum]